MNPPHFSIKTQLITLAPDEFEAEFDSLPESVQDELLAQAKVIEQFGPAAKRPRVDTLKGSYKRLIDVADRRFGEHLNRIAPQ